MKYLRALIISLLSFIPNENLDILGKYEAALGEDKSWFELKKDQTFYFKYVGDYNWLHHQEQGTWQIKHDILELKCIYEEDEEVVIIQQEFNSRKTEEINITVKDKYDSPISDIGVYYQLNLDNSQAEYKTTDENGKAVFKQNIFNLCYIETQAEISFDNKKFMNPYSSKGSYLISLLSNEINVAINRDPRIKIVEDTDYFIMHDSLLIGYNCNSNGRHVKYVRKKNRN